MAHVWRLLVGWLVYHWALVPNLPCAREALSSWHPSFPSFFVQCKRAPPKKKSNALRPPRGRCSARPSWPRRDGREDVHRLARCCTPATRPYSSSASWTRAHAVHTHGKPVSGLTLLGPPDAARASTRSFSSGAGDGARSAAIVGTSSRRNCQAAVLGSPRTLSRPLAPQKHALACKQDSGPGQPWLHRRCCCRTLRA